MRIPDAGQVRTRFLHPLLWLFCLLVHAVAVHSLPPGVQSSVPRLPCPPGAPPLRPDDTSVGCAAPAARALRGMLYRGHNRMERGPHSDELLRPFAQTGAQVADELLAGIEARRTDPNFAGPNLGKREVTDGHTGPEFALWNSTYHLTDDTYTHIGWMRINATLPASEYGGARFAGVRPTTFLGGWNDRPECELQSEQPTETHWTNAHLNKKLTILDVVRVSVCKGSVRPHLRVMRKLLTLCTCIRRREEDTTELDVRWLEGFVAWYKRLGVDHFYFYVSHVPHVRLAANVSYNWIDMSWVSSFHSKSAGQVWAINDCLHRNRLQRNAWGLFVDLDELAVVPSAKMSSPGALRVLVKELHVRSPDVNWISIASAPYVRTSCGDAASLDPLSALDAITYRLPIAEGSRQPTVCMEERCDVGDSNCYAAFCDHVNQDAVGCYFNTAASGRRKLLLRHASANVISFHWVNKPARGLRFNTMMYLGSNRAWLKHVRGAAFTDGECEGDSPSCMRYGEKGILRCKTFIWKHNVPFNQAQSHLVPGVYVADGNMTATAASQDLLEGSYPGCLNK